MSSTTDPFGEFHKLSHNHTNYLLHAIGVPAIYIGLMIGLTWISVSFAELWHVTFAWLLTLSLAVYYIIVDKRLGAITSLILIVLTAICSGIAFPAPHKATLILFILLFFGGWLLLFIAHNTEKTHAAFQKKAASLLMAPLFFTSELLTSLNLEKYLGAKSSKEKSSIERKK